MGKAKEQSPHVAMVVKPIDGGQAKIGIIDCPWCGETHYTMAIHCGERWVFCGKDKPGVQRKDGYSAVNVVKLF